MKASLPTSTSGSQRFTKATLMVSGSSHAVVTPAQLKRWKEIGSYAKLGFYTGTEARIGTQSFRNAEKGLVQFVSSTKHVFLANGSFLTAYKAAGGPRGAWGTLVKGKTRLDDGSDAVFFTNGMAVYTKKTGVKFIKGKVLGEEQEPVEETPPEEPGTSDSGANGPEDPSGSTDPDSGNGDDTADGSSGSDGSGDPDGSEGSDSGSDSGSDANGGSDSTGSQPTLPPAVSQRDERY